MKLRHTTISIPAGPAWLDGELAHAPDVLGLAVILRPAGGPRAQCREMRIADALQRAGYATLVVNLLTAYEESRDPDAAFNVPQMANRVVAVAEWIGHQPPLAALAVGVVASGTASGAAIRAAWKTPESFAAIVCAAGRPDLAGATPLKALTTPTRFAVGSEDPQRPMLTNAYEHLSPESDWQTIDGAGATFAEPGAVDRVAARAAEWFARHLPAARPERASLAPPEGHVRQPD